MIFASLHFLRRGFLAFLLHDHFNPSIHQLTAMNQYDTFVLPIHPSSFNHGYQTTADKGAWFQTIQEMSTEDLDTFNLLCHNNQGLMDNAQIRFILSELLRRKASMINTEASLPQSGSKRKAEDEYAACADCKGEFLLCDGTTNNQELCYFHHGKLISLVDIWHPFIFPSLFFPFY